MPVYIQALGTAVPSFSLSQEAVRQFMAQAQGLTQERSNQLKILYRASGIQKRYTVLEDYTKKMGEFEFFPNSPDLEPFPSTQARMQVYEQSALPLSIAAIRDAVGEDFDFQKVTHLVTVSCTGMYAPGLDIDLVRHLGFRTSIKRTAINFMGCYGAFNAIKTAQQICLAQPDAVVMAVCVELCSLHFQKGQDEDNLLANALFGDGAAAVVLRAIPQPGIQFSLDHFYNDLAFNGLQDMAWRIGDFGFEMKLTSMVPEIIRGGIAQLAHRLLAGMALSVQDIDFFAIHPGGKKILEVIEEVFLLSRQDNRFAYEVMRDYGNMSSATVLFVLKKLMSSLSPEDRGKRILSFAFGPGLTLESMLLGVKFF